MEDKVNHIKKIFHKDKPFIKWNDNWEKKAISLFLNDFKTNLLKTKIYTIGKSELITGKNRLIGVKSDKIIKDCKVLGDLNFRWLKDVKGDGNCYYRSLICGYIETLLTDKPEYIEAYLSMIIKGNKIFNFEEKEDKKTREVLIPILKRLVKIRNSIGIQKALQEYFLDSLISDDLNLVRFFIQFFRVLFCY